MKPSLAEIPRLRCNRCCGARLSTAAAVAKASSCPNQGPRVAELRRGAAGARPGLAAGREPRGGARVAPLDDKLFKQTSFIENVVPKV